MGGIAGWIGGRNAPGEAALAAPLEALAHRGGEGAGIFTFCADTGHRLAFGPAHCDPQAGIALVLDGPIANKAQLQKALAPRGHRFDAGTASEALLRAYEQWDKDVVQHLRGAFAFALWDAHKERLMLARDRFGEKPLYIYERGGVTYFTSQVRALVRMPGVQAPLDPAALREHLEYGYVAGPRTLLAGIRKLAPGTTALWQFGRLRESRYWFPPDKQAGMRRACPDPVGEFTRKLDEAVQMHLPAGVLLSGGVDSSALVALASRHGAVKTFAAGFADDPASELADARRVAQRFGAEHHEIVLSPREVVARLPDAVRERDAPVSRPADVALHFMACEAARSARTVLTGEGADEVIGGYRRYIMERYGFRLRRVSWTGAGHDGLFAGARAACAPKDRPPSDAHPGASRLRRALYLDQSSWLPDNVLERTDRMTMAASLEARAPFLDHRLAEFVSALPDGLRVRGLATKWILRRAAQTLLAGLVPGKAGFRLPVGEWLRGELREFLLEHLRGQGSRTRPYYDARALDRLLEEHIAGRRNHEQILWTLINLEIWHRACGPG